MNKTRYLILVKVAGGNCVWIPIEYTGTGASSDIIAVIILVPGPYKEMSPWCKVTNIWIPGVPVNGNICKWEDKAGDWQGLIS